MMRLESCHARFESASAALERYHAKLATPFAVLGIRTLADRVTDIDYLAVGIETLAPTTELAERTCVEIERYLGVFGAEGLVKQPVLV